MNSINIRRVTEKNGVGWIIDGFLRFQMSQICHFSHFVVKEGVVTWGMRKCLNKTEKGFLVEKDGRLPLLTNDSKNFYLFPVRGTDYGH